MKNNVGRSARLLLLFFILSVMCLIVSAAILFVNGQWTMFAATVEFHEETVYEMEDISSVTVDGILANVILDFSERKDAHIAYYGKATEELAKALRMEVSIVGDTLFITQAGDYNRGEGFNVGDLYIEVTLPNEYSGGINISVFSGGVSSMAECSLSSFAAQTSSGTIEVNGVTTGGLLGLITSSGAIEVNNAFAEGLRLESSSGKVKCDSISVNKMYVKTQGGDIWVSVLSSKDIDINTNSGTVELLLPKEYAPNVDFSSGSGRLKNTFIEKGTLPVRISTSTGNAYISDLQAE